MPIDCVRKHFASTVIIPPFFLFVSDGKYNAVIDEMKLSGVEFISMSNFCGDEDKLADIDAMISYLETADANVNNNKLVVIGLGEYLALRGNDEITQWLSRLKDLNVGGAKVVILLRGVVSLLSNLQADPRFDNRRFCVIEKAECDLTFTVAKPSIGLPALSGFKAMLKELENGRCGNVVVSTSVNLENALFTVHRINNAYEGIVRFYVKGFPLARSCGIDSHWEELLGELSQSDGSLDAVFAKYSLGDDLVANLYARIAGQDFRNWLYFICLKCKADTTQNSYLRYVLDKTGRFEDFTENILNAIIEIPHTDKSFNVFYAERKSLVKKFPEAAVAKFVGNNRQVVSESIYKLTDQTRVEREEIVTLVSKNGEIRQMDEIYPALASYLKPYVFRGIEAADLLTEYFAAYKRQKLSNEIEPDFLAKVEELAHNRSFINHLPSRNALIERIDKDGTFLFWLDALGVEYLSLIEDLAQRRGLSLKISIARAELPTVTSINRNFFDNWTAAKNGTNGDKRLDDVKHEDAGGYDFTKNELPIHLASELEIITDVIERAATELASRNYTRFLIASDHGASRLAVLHKKEEKYDTDTVGKYSGRCCKSFSPHDLPFAAEDSGYLVLADYGRFKGSRAANVEVHGGASLEEVIVPLIELSLIDGSVTVKIVDEDKIVADFRKGVTIKLFFNSPVNDVTVILSGAAHSASQIEDAQHYSVILPELKRAGEYPADVYAGDNLIGKIMIKAQGRSGKVNDDFDDLF